MNNQRFFQIKLEQYILWSASLAIIEARRQACTRTPRKLHPAKGARQAAGCPALMRSPFWDYSVLGDVCLKLTRPIAPPNWLFSWPWDLSVSWASLVPPAAGNASR